MGNAVTPRLRTASTGRALALTVALTIVVGAKANAADPLYAKLGPLFVTAVHRDDPLSAPTQKLSRWTISVRVVLAGRRLATWQPRVQDWLAELARASGHDFAMAREPPLNVAVLFADGYAAEIERSPVFKDLLQHYLKNPSFLEHLSESERTNVPCFWMVNRVNDAIESAVMMISERAADPTQRVCLYSWLLGITGLSIWNMRMIGPELIDDSAEGRATLTEAGVQLLRMLYDPRLRDQMSVDETLPLLPSIVDGLR